MVDTALRALERQAHGGDFNAAVRLEIEVARLTGACPCGSGPIEENSIFDCAVSEVTRDFDEHGAYRPTLADLLA